MNVKCGLTPTDHLFAFKYRLKRLRSQAYFCKLTVVNDTLKYAAHKRMVITSRKDLGWELSIIKIELIENIGHFLKLDKISCKI